LQSKASENLIVCKYKSLLSNYQIVFIRNLVPVAQAIAKAEIELNKTPNLLAD